MADIDPEPPRDPVLDALRALDREGFSFLVAVMWQQSKHAGGFRDKVGWTRVRAATDAYINGLRSEG